ncbi:MAG: hypothetical protein OXG10_03560 [Candidatus Dadabacteria bacterium]|nr:hypothetical protein [Candidatus Dadabacteria bacterium]
MCATTCGLHCGNKSFAKKLIAKKSFVRQIMESHPVLTETMEPLWHAVRAETGEELESLPAEITQAVIDIRKRFSEKKKMLPGTTPLSSR